MLLGNRFGIAIGGIHAVVVVAFRSLNRHGVVSACRCHVLSPSGLEWHQQTQDQQTAETHGDSLVAVLLHSAINACRP
jgi:hypothetical protein